MITTPAAGYSRLPIVTPAETSSGFCTLTLLGNSQSMSTPLKTEIASDVLPNIARFRVPAPHYLLNTLVMAGTARLRAIRSKACRSTAPVDPTADVGQPGMSVGYYYSDRPLLRLAETRLVFNRHRCGHIIPLDRRD